MVGDAETASEQVDLVRIRFVRRRKSSGSTGVRSYGVGMNHGGADKARRRQKAVDEGKATGFIDWVRKNSTVGGSC